MTNLNSLQQLRWRMFTLVRTLYKKNIVLFIVLLSARLSCKKSSSLKKCKLIACKNTSYTTPKITFTNTISSITDFVLAWPLRIMFIASTPWMVEQADLKCLNPSIWFVIRLICEWSCSMILFIYFDDRYFVLGWSLSFLISFLIVAIVAAYLSVVMTLGLLLCTERIAFLNNFLAVLRFLDLDSQKSIVWPCWSTALYR